MGQSTRTLTLLIVALVGTMGFLINKMKPDTPDEALVEKLSQEIVNPNVSAASLQQKGYFSDGRGTIFIDACRDEYLKTEFAKNATQQDLAKKITDCAIKGAVSSYSNSVSDGIISGVTIGSFPTTGPTILIINP